MNKKIILSLFLLVAHLHSQEEKFTKEYIEENAVIHIGSVSQQAVAIKHFIVLFAVHEKQNNGASADSWIDFENLGFDLASFEKDMRVDFSEIYAFVSSESVDGKAPVMVNRAPVDYRSNGSLGRYVIWFEEDGSYYFSKVPEEEIESLFSKYKVELLVSEKPPATATGTPTAPPVVNIAEAIEKVTAPEPAIEEEHAEVVVTEPIEEDVEQSSNWWLWLISAVVVLGGVGLVLRRKS
ncbi:MAG: hypothetical protein ACPGSB_05050 [Opitutales bacterium]